MSEYDRWEIAAVLPEDFLEFDDWVFQKAEPYPGGIVYHRHGDSLFMVGDNHKCRDCNASAPPGILFLARTSRINDIEV